MTKVVPGKKNPTDNVGEEIYIGLLAECINLFLVSYFAMLAFGMAYSVDHSIPHFGYLYTLFFVWIAQYIVSSATLGLIQRVKKLAKLIVR